MKQNLLVISYDYDLSKQLAEKLSETFSMRVFDQIALFEFDHSPRTLGNVFAEHGRDYVNKKFRSLLKMELDFDDAVFVCDLSIADHSEDLFFKINLSNFVIFLHKNVDIEIEQINNKTYKSAEERNFFVCTKEELLAREQKISEYCADVNIDITGIDEDKILEVIISEIKGYYSVN